MKTIYSNLGTIREGEYPRASEAKFKINEAYYTVDDRFGKGLNLDLRLVNSLSNTGAGFWIMDELTPSFLSHMKVNKLEELMGKEVTALVEDRRVIGLY